jgi:hypothetical protein
LSLLAVAGGMATAWYSTRAEEAGRDVVAASGQVGDHAELCGGNVDFGAPLRPVAGGRECMHDRVGGGRDFRGGFQVIGQGAESADNRGASSGIGVVHQASPLWASTGAVFPAAVISMPEFHRKSRAAPSR